MSSLALTILRYFSAQSRQPSMLHWLRHAAAHDCSDPRHNLISANTKRNTPLPFTIGCTWITNVIRRSPSLNGHSPANLLAINDGLATPGGALPAFGVHR